MLTISPHKITYHKRGKNKTALNCQNLSDNNHRGKFSESSRKRLLTRLKCWLMAECYYMKHGQLCKKPKRTKYTFLTLTIPTEQRHTDQEIKSKVLNNYLNKLRYYRPNIKYIWRAEKQKNGNIHFHLILNTYIDKNLNDRLWWDSLELLGYVSRYEKKWGGRNPMGNRIECVKDSKKIVGYCSKYIAKCSDEKGCEGRMWYACTELQTETKAIAEINERALEFMYLDLTKNGCYVTENEYVMNFHVNSLSDIDNLPPWVQNKYHQLIEYIHCRWDEPLAYPSKFFDTVLN